MHRQQFDILDTVPQLTLMRRYSLISLSCLVVDLSVRRCCLVVDVSDSGLCGNVSTRILINASLPIGMSDDVRYLFPILRERCSK